MYVCWRTYHRKKQPQSSILCDYIYQRVRIEGRPKAIALSCLGSIWKVNDPLEQQQFWQNVEAKIIERQWQGGEREKILGTIATRVLCPVSDSEKLVTGIERQIAASRDRAPDTLIAYLKHLGSEPPRKLLSKTRPIAESLT